jgi:predicted nucleotidyltransferase component of viral defense system
MVEKVLHLLNLLNALNSHPFLKGKWVLKGGTALNMFIFDLPRLSVDIDLNYIGALDREEMLVDRPKFDQAAQAVFSREGFTTKRVPDEHAGGKWRLRYKSFTGQSGNLEVDLNFMFRQPLWDIWHADSHRLGDFLSMNIPILDRHELAAGKLVALLARGQARDLFDSHRILNLDDLDIDRQSKVPTIKLMITVKIIKEATSSPIVKT